MRRRQALLSTAAVLASIAGCATNKSSSQTEASGPQTESETRTSTETPVTAPTETPDPPSAAPLSEEVAKERALQAEKKYLETHLQSASCLNSWGTYATVVEKEATVVNRTANSVSVEVTHPYWYGTDNEEADSGSDALYRVTAEGVQRTSGDDIQESLPC